ncbi:hypothetical protein EAH78_00855 [Pseudomonas arsenicoxydans]|uniref:Uncharacterized protein n=1 Tax=Pseudomonas arsenicoxydans TaxID=702115 RepID=A0A502I5W4_9PSED|nr:hypothetical protein EAH78_00855 [Pseudomonas arsenicoxydans]
MNHSFVEPVRAPSRASPLPHLTEFLQRNTVECGSGLAREGAISNTENPTAVTPAAQTPPRYTLDTAQTPLSPGQPPAPVPHRRLRHPVR